MLEEKYANIARMQGNCHKHKTPTTPKYVISPPGRFKRISAQGTKTTGAQPHSLRARGGGLAVPFCGGLGERTAEARGEATATGRQLISSLFDLRTFSAATSPAMPFDINCFKPCSDVVGVPAAEAAGVEAAVLSEAVESFFLRTGVDGRGGMEPPPLGCWLAAGAGCNGAGGDLRSCKSSEPS